jgi:hypothetical protein
MYCFIYVLWFVFSVVNIQTRRRWAIFKNKNLCNLRSKASESLNKSAYYSLYLFSICHACNVNMNHSMFTFPYHFLVALVVGLHMGSIV